MLHCTPMRAHSLLRWNAIKMIFISTCHHYMFQAVTYMSFLQLPDRILNYIWLFIFLLRHFIHSQLKYRAYFIDFASPTLPDSSRYLRWRFYYFTGFAELAYSRHTSQNGLSPILARRLGLVIISRYKFSHSRGVYGFLHLQNMLLRASQASFAPYLCWVFYFSFLRLILPPLTAFLV